jgi:transposase
MIAGVTDADQLAELARGRLRSKIPALREALENHFDAHHAAIARSALAHLDQLDDAIDTVSATINTVIAPYEWAIELLCTIPGVSRRTSECLIAEIGADMTVFPTAGHLASWAGMCPGNNKSAGRTGPAPPDRARCGSASTWWRPPTPSPVRATTTSRPATGASGLDGPLRDHGVTLDTDTAVAYTLARLDAFLTNAAD